MFLRRQFFGSIPFISVITVSFWLFFPPFHFPSSLQVYTKKPRCRRGFWQIDRAGISVSAVYFAGGIMQLEYKDNICRIMKDSAALKIAAHFSEAKSDRRFMSRMIIRFCFLSTIFSPDKNWKALVTVTRLVWRRLATSWWLKRMEILIPSAVSVPYSCRSEERRVGKEC